MNGCFAKTVVKVCLIVLLIVTFIELNLFSFFKKKKFFYSPYHVNYIFMQCFHNTSQSIDSLR